MMIVLIAWTLMPLVSLVHGKVHTFHFTTGWTSFKPDGVRDKRMISFNGQWPLPEIHVNKGDRVELYLTNGFEDLTTSLHFHGLFHNTSDGNHVQMDGPPMVTQCPIQPGDTYLYNFTVGNQVGTFWYHSHTGAQFADGMAGAFIIHDDNMPVAYDEEKTVFLSDMYNEPYYELAEKFMSRYNPMGTEPIPADLLLNYSLHASIEFQPGKTYLLRIINGAFFVSQYLYIEDHTFEIVEVDGVYVTRTETDMLYLASGQRMSVLVQAKDTAAKNYALMQIIDARMLDVIPAELELNRTHQIRYNAEQPPALPYLVSDLSVAMDEFNLETAAGHELYQKYDRQIVLKVEMNNLIDGVNYAMFNGITHVSPKVPTLNTVLSSGDMMQNPAIYGNTNPFILEHGDIVEIVINNWDTSPHPFHLHGHNFQIVQKSPAFEGPDAKPVPYNESSPLAPFPQHPMTRDTAILESNGHLVLRFKADNPGVWLFHCHVNWHMEQGLAATFIEAPYELSSSGALTDNYIKVCASGNYPIAGNAAGHVDRWLDLSGLPTQPDPIPKGFTFRGYFALCTTAAVGIWGLVTIARFGLQYTVEGATMYDQLESLLKEHSMDL